MRQKITTKMKGQIKNRLAVLVFVSILALNLAPSYSLVAFGATTDKLVTEASSSAPVTVNPQPDTSAAPTEEASRALDDAMLRAEALAGSRAEDITPAGSERNPTLANSSGSGSVDATVSDEQPSGEPSTSRTSRITDYGFSYDIDLSLPMLLMPLDSWKMVFRNKLASGEKELYDACYNQLLNASSYETDSKRSYLEVMNPDNNLSKDAINRVKMALEHDEPRLFQVDFKNSKAIEENGKIVGLRFVMRDQYKTVEAYHKALISIEKSISRILGQIKPDMNFYQMYGTVFHALDSSVVTYGYSGSVEERSMDSAFLKHRVVKEGYCKALTYLAQRLDLLTYWVSGSESTYGGKHAWNYIKIYDQWFITDATWQSRWFLTGEKGPASDVRASNRTPDEQFGPAPQLAPRSIVWEASLPKSQLMDTNGRIDIVRFNDKLVVSFDTEDREGLNKQVALNLKSLGFMPIPMTSDGNGRWSVSLDLVKLKLGQLKHENGEIVKAADVIYSSEKANLDKTDVKKAVDLLKMQGQHLDFFFTINNIYRTDGNVMASIASYKQDEGSVFAEFTMTGQDLSDLDYNKNDDDKNEKEDTAGGGTSGGDSQGYVESSRVFDLEERNIPVKSVAVYGALKPESVLRILPIVGSDQQAIEKSEAYVSSKDQLKDAKQLVMLDVALTSAPRLNMVNTDGSLDSHDQQLSKGSLTVTFDLGVEKAGKAMKVLHIIDIHQGSFEIFKSKVDSRGILTIVTNSFSPFIVFEDVSENDGAGGSNTSDPNVTPEKPQLPDSGSIGGGNSSGSSSNGSGSSGKPISSSPSTDGNKNQVTKEPTKGSNLLTNDDDGAAAANNRLQLAMNLNESEKSSISQEQLIVATGKKVSEKIYSELKHDAVIRDRVKIQHNEIVAVGPIARFLSIIVPVGILIAALVALYYAHKENHY